MTRIFYDKCVCQVRGPVTNKTWQSIGLRWVQPNLDETVTLFPEERGGLEMYVNLEKVSVLYYIPAL